METLLSTIFILLVGFTNIERTRWNMSFLMENDSSNMTVPAVHLIDARASRFPSFLGAQPRTGRTAALCLPVCPFAVSINKDSRMTTRCGDAAKRKRQRLKDPAIQWRQVRIQPLATPLDAPRMVNMYVRDAESQDTVAKNAKGDIGKQAATGTSAEWPNTQKCEL